MGQRLNAGYEFDFHSGNLISPWSRQSAVLGSATLSEETRKRCVLTVSYPNGINVEIFTDDIFPLSL